MKPTLAFLPLVVALFLGAFSSKTQAADTYAAIAFSPTTGMVKASWNYPTREGALKRAISACGGNPVSYSIKNGWLAIAVGDGNGYGWGWGSTKAVAEKNALFHCAKHTKNGRIRRSMYSSYTGE